MEFALDFLAPTVTIISILGFTFYINHRLEDKLERLSLDNMIGHNEFSHRLQKIEDKIGVSHG